MDRIKLVITEVKEPRPVGQTEVLEFFAHVGTDTKTLRYGVWSKSLYEYIKKDAVIDCDMDTKISDKNDPDGNPYVSRKITQIYIDGKPVGLKQQGRFGKSSEQIMIETKGRAKNTALMQACEILKTDKIKLNEILTWADKFYSWLTTGDTEVKSLPISVPKPLSATLPATRTPVESAAGSNPLPKATGIDMDWLKESFEALQWAGVGGYLQRTYKVTGTKISELVEKLTPEQKAAFVKEVSDRLDMLKSNR